MVTTLRATVFGNRLFVPLCCLLACPCLASGQVTTSGIVGKWRPIEVNVNGKNLETNNTLFLFFENGDADFSGTKSTWRLDDRLQVLTIRTKGILFSSTEHYTVRQENGQMQIERTVSSFLVGTIRTKIVLQRVH